MSFTGLFSPSPRHPLQNAAWQDTSPAQPYYTMPMRITRNSRSRYRWMREHRVVPQERAQYLELPHMGNISTVHRRSPARNGLKWFCQGKDRRASHTWHYHLPFLLAHSSSSPMASPPHKALSYRHSPQQTVATECFSSNTLPLAQSQRAGIRCRLLGPPAAFDSLQQLYIKICTGCHPPPQLSRPSDKQNQNV